MIQSGLDSIVGDGAESIVLLFKSMAVFAEDQVVEVAIISVLWASLSIAKGKKMSAIVVRQWLSELLSRSVLIGSVGEGVAMHDLVRDFTLSSFTAAELRQLQREFVTTMLQDYTAAAKESTKTATTVRSYATSEMTHHLEGAVTVPLCDDELARAVLLHESDGIVDQVQEQHEQMHLNHGELFACMCL